MTPSAAAATDTPPAIPAPADPASGQSRRCLLDAALREFARFGLQGARLERIAAEAGYAKRMIYYHFANKTQLYVAVLNDAYQGIRQSEAALNLDALPPHAALRQLASHSFDYHQRYADFTRLVLIENMQGGRMMDQLGESGDELRRAALDPLAKLLLRGEAAGIFRPGLRAGEVHYLISAMSAFRVDHAGTWRQLLQIDMLGPEATARHRDMMLRLLDDFVLIRGAEPSELPL